MALSRCVALAFLGVVLAAPGLFADGPAAPPAPNAGASEPGWLSEAFGALRVRMEARLDTARLLEKQGRFDEALATYRTVDDLWTEGLRTVREIATLRPQAGAQEGPRPARSRGSSRVPSDDPPPSPEAKAIGDAAEAVERALLWLKAHQAEDGSWSATKPVYAPGVTGLAMLAFTGAGYSHRGDHPFPQGLARAVEYLLGIQDAEGCFGPRTTQHYIYNHGIATLALTEMYALTEDARLREPVQKALDFIAEARNPYLAWRYGVRPGDNDTSVTSWMVLALRSARAVRGRPMFAIDETAFEGALAWVDKMTDPDYGRVGYITRGSGPARPSEMIARFPTDKSEAMTAAALVMRLHAGQDPKRPEIQKGLALVSRLPPVWNPGDGSIDMYYWFFGTLACFHAGGDTWVRWDEALRAALLPSQRRDGDATTTLGSWDPIDPWSSDAGPVYSTALMAICLEISGRFTHVVGVR
jgi:hypothetical protein